MDEQVSLFLEITSTEDPEMATSFLEMSGGNLETAVSLFFEHGTGVASNSSSNNNNNNESGGNSGANDLPGFETDEALAHRFQQDIYQEDANNQGESEVRRPIEPMHDQLVQPGYGGMFSSMMANRNSEQGMFGRAEVGIFNQLDGDEFQSTTTTVTGGGYQGGGDEFEDDDDSISMSDDDNDYDVHEVLNSDGDIVIDTTRRTRRRPARRIRPVDTRTNTQRRLANIFRPPWDIIQRLDLDGAKQLARQEKKWILINIQDMSDFRCQCLNRDFWSSQNIKDIVHENFVFLQYHHDSPNGEFYTNMYPFTEFPHIAILDPITGERLKIWSGVNPEIHKWIEQVMDFMGRFSLTGGSNPSVSHQTKVRVDTLSEDQQIKLAMENSLGNGKNASGENVDDVVVLEDTDKGMTKDDAIDLDSDDGKKQEEEEGLPSDHVDPNSTASIKAVDHPDPDVSVDVKQTTRIQIRSGDGKRVVKKFMLADPVLKLFEFVKFSFADSLNGKEFKLTLQRVNLIEDDGLEKTIESAGLKSASVLLEVVDSDDDDE